MNSFRQVLHSKTDTTATICLALGVLVVVFGFIMLCIDDEVYVGLSTICVLVGLAVFVIGMIAAEKVQSELHALLRRRYSSCQIQSDWQELSSAEQKSVSLRFAP